MSRALRIAYIPTESAGVNFYRVWQPAETLRKMGVEVAVLWYSHGDVFRHAWQQDLESEYRERIINDIEMACEWADAVIWMGIHNPNAMDLFQNLRQQYRHKAFLAEFDDIFFKIPEGNQAASHYYPGSGPVRLVLDQIRSVDGVIVSTPALKTMLNHPKIYVCENAIDLNLWRDHSPARQGLTLGWVGGASHNADLALVKNSLLRAVREFPNLTVKILHGCPEFLKHKDDCVNLIKPGYNYNKMRRCPECGGLERILWTHNFYTINRYPEWVSRHKFDIGLAPLVDNSFNRAKSNLRWLEYSAMGIPTIASPVSHFVKSIKDGETGFFARNEEEWFNQIACMVNEPARRENVGTNAMEEVKTKWNPSVQAEKVKAAVEDVLNAKPNTIDSSHQDWRLNGRPVESGVVGN